MINLLPPEVKSQIAFSKRNAKARRLVAVLFLSAGLVGGLVVYTQMTLGQRIRSGEAEIKSLEEGTDTSTQQKVKDINGQLTAIKKLRQSKNHYSAVVRDLASVLPGGTSIQSIALAGDGKPLKLVINAADFEVATQVRESLASSQRVAAVDIDSISSGTGGYSVSVTIAFKPGQDK